MTRFMYTAAKIIVTTLLASMLTALTEWAVAEAFVHWYMKQHGVSVRAELSEDYGFGMTGFALSVGVLLLTLPFWFAIAWRVNAWVMNQYSIRRSA